MNVVPFRPRLRHPTGQFGPLSPPAALGTYGPADAQPVDATEERRRMQQNLAAFLAVTIIVVLGGWLIDRLSSYSRTMACIEANHRKCKLLEVEPASPWDRAGSTAQASDGKRK